MAEPQQYVVRPPRAGDIEELGRLHFRVWRETYATLMAPEALARLSPESFARSWARRIEQMSPPGHHPSGEVVELAVLAERPVGFSSVGPPRDEDAPVQRQLWALNLLSEHQGTGLADRLIGSALGDAPAYLWVAQGNERAIGFYRRHGFVEDGARVDRQDGMTELRMVRGG